MSPRRPSWLTVEEVAAQLGTSLAAVYEDITAGRLPAQRYGQSFLVRRADVEAHDTIPDAIAG